MRQGNFLEGILAGINSYKQTRQWVEGMEQNKLQTEKMRMGNDMASEQLKDVQNPQRVWNREAGRQNYLATSELATNKRLAPELRELRAGDIRAEEGTKFGIEQEQFPAKLGMRAQQNEQDINQQIEAKKQELAMQFENFKNELRFRIDNPVPTTTRPMTTADRAKIVESTANMMSAFGYNDKPEQLNFYPMVYDAMMSGDPMRARAILTVQRIEDDDPARYRWLNNLDPNFKMTVETDSGPQQIGAEEYAALLAYSGASGDEIRSALAEAKRQAMAMGYVPNRELVGPKEPPKHSIKGTTINKEILFKD